jgi:hypothetical protein
MGRAFADGATRRLIMGPGAILLIWEEVPDSTKMFLFENLTQEQYDKICSAHGTFINLDNEGDGVRFVNEYIFDAENGKYRFEPILDAQNNITNGKPLYMDRPVTVVWCGFML